MAVQSWNIDAHSILVVSEEGSDGDIRRAVENHRGMGVGTMTAIRAGEHTNTSLASVTNGTITWNGTDYTGLDLSSAGTGPLRAAALTELLEDDSIAPTISFIDGQYVAIFRWSPTQTPNFAVAASNDAVAAFGFSPTDSTYPGGPVHPGKGAWTERLIDPDQAPRLPGGRSQPGTGCDTESGKGIRDRRGGME